MQTMYLVIEENLNCAGDERMFSESGKRKLVKKLNVESPLGSRNWWNVTGVDPGGNFAAAQAVIVEDSGAGNAWLIFGGSWGLRFRPVDSSASWDLSNPTQWGTAFKVLDISAEDIEFETN